MRTLILVLAALVVPAGCAASPSPSGDAADEAALTEERAARLTAIQHLLTVERPFESDLALVDDWALTGLRAGAPEGVRVETWSRWWMNQYLLERLETHVTLGEFVGVEVEGGYAMIVVRTEDETLRIFRQASEFGGVDYDAGEVSRPSADRAVVEASASRHLLAARWYEFVLRKTGDGWEVESCVLKRLS